MYPVGLFPKILYLLIVNKGPRTVAELYEWQIGGEGGIRTPDRLAPMPHFECGAFNHSATSPTY